MGKPKGLTKSGGRVKGTKNKNSFHLSDFIDQYNFDPVQELVETVKTLEKENKAVVLLKLMEFVVPKRKAIDADTLSGKRTGADLASYVHENGGVVSTIQPPRTLNDFYAKIGEEEKAYEEFKKHYFGQEKAVP